MTQRNPYSIWGHVSQNFFSDGDDDYRDIDDVENVNRVVVDSLTGVAPEDVPAHVAAAATESVGDALERLRAH